MIGAQGWRVTAEEEEEVAEDDRKRRAIDLVEHEGR